MLNICIFIVNFTFLCKELSKRQIHSHSVENDLNVISNINKRNWAKHINSHVVKDHS